MKKFRRTGLEDDDDIAASPPALQSRPAGPQHQYASTIYVEAPSSGAWEEESVVSAMTTTSDLESVYNERSSNKLRPTNLRERFLLQHTLPDPTRTVSSILAERGRRSPPNTSASPPTKVQDDDNYSGDTWTMDNTWLRPHQRQPFQMTYPGKVFLDPHEKAYFDYQKGVATWYSGNEFHWMQGGFRAGQAPPDENMRLPQPRRPTKRL